MNAVTIAQRPDGVYSVDNTLPHSAGLPPFALPAHYTTVEARNASTAMIADALRMPRSAVGAWKRIGYTTLADGRRRDAFRAMLPDTIPARPEPVRYR